jgi:alkylation response protein AidB-like acyl-CoA dehydrogenase
MRFALNDEQQALSEATRDFFSSRVTSDSIRSAITSVDGFDVSLWNDMCSNLGLAGLIVSENFGGFGASDVELAVVMEHHGYTLAPSPLRVHAGAIMAVQECANENVRAEHLNRLVSGESIGFADFYGESGTDIRVSPNESSVIVNGTFERVPFGMHVSYLYALVELKSETHVICVDCTGPSIDKIVVPSIDQTQPIANIVCSATPAEIISITDPRKSFARATSRAVIAACNEMVGSTQAALDMSVAYAKDRIQFGRPIGSFQAIKHKCAEMLLETESARSISLYGSWLASQSVNFTNDELEDDLDHVASMAKYYTAKALNHAAGENIQIHGGIGFTMEHDAQLYFKRAAFMNAHLGLPSFHSNKLVNDLRARTAV